MSNSLRILIFITLSLIVAAITTANPAGQEESNSSADLYRVYVESVENATVLSACGVKVLLKIDGGYLVLADGESAGRLVDSGLKHELISTNISRSNLALDIRMDDYNARRFPIVYEEDGLRLLRADYTEISKTEISSGLAPILTEHLVIAYDKPVERDWLKAAVDIDLETIIAQVSTDSLISYLETLQSFGVRLAGTSANYAARDWIAGKFTEFGYDSVVIDSFTANIGGFDTECQNVVAVKVGTEYPDFKIIVGGHHDAVQGSPGADDNGTGTIGTLETARILKDIDTRLTFVFMTFDAEEEGLLGAWHYANRARLNGDSIALVLNMDMIGHFQNSGDGKVYHGPDDSYAQLWINLADSLPGINITGHLSGTSGGSDHYPFIQNGFNAIFAHEYIFSTVYHSPQDSTTYINYDYFTRMLQATLATAAYVDNTFIPAPWLIMDFPDDTPQLLTPETPTTFNVSITSAYGGQIVPGSARLNYIVDGGSLLSTEMTSTGGDLFEAVIPGLACGNRVEYYVSVEEAVSGVITLPGPDRPLTAAAADGMTVIFEDNFELNTGWTVSGDAADGQWERGIPAGGGLRGDPPTDYNGNGWCYLTDNVEGNSDVDDGSTYLTSPQFSIPSDGFAMIHYARWYSNDFGNAPHADIFYVELSNNDGAFYFPAETVGPVEESSGGWYEASLWVDEIITPSSQMRLRFNASDLGNGSVVEAAVDDFYIYHFSCSSSGLYIADIDLPDWTEGLYYSQYLIGGGGTGEITWADKYGDLGGTGLSLNTNGRLWGTPTVNGVISFTAEITDEAMDTYEREMSVNINPALVITTESIPDGGLFEGYSYQMESSGGTGTITFSDITDALVGTGLSMSSDGLISGTPGGTGIIDLTVQAEDEVGATDSKLLSFQIIIPYICGDANGDEIVNILDITYTISFLYKGGPAPDPYEAADVNDDATVNILDITYLINHLYKGGPAPVCLW